MMGLLSEVIQMSKHLKGRFEGLCLLVNRKDAQIIQILGSLPLLPEDRTGLALQRIGWLIEGQRRSTV